MLWFWGQKLLDLPITPSVTDWELAYFFELQSQHIFIEKGNFFWFRQFSNAYYSDSKEWVSSRQQTVIVDVGLEIDDDRCFHA